MGYQSEKSDIYKTRTESLLRSRIEENRESTDGEMKVLRAWYEIELDVMQDDPYLCYSEFN